MALLIEALDILYTKDVGTFCLVSSDCDFTPLVLRLRADGKQVIGFGEKKSAEPFVASCTRFLYLNENLSAKVLTAADPKERANSLKHDTTLIKMLRRSVEANADDDGWAALSGVGNHIRNQGSFDSRNYGFSKLSDLFTAIDLFELKKHTGPSGTIYSVRLGKSAS